MFPCPLTYLSWAPRHRYLACWNTSPSEHRILHLTLVTHERSSGQEAQLNRGKKGTNLEQKQDNITLVLTKRPGAIKYGFPLLQSLWISPGWALGGYNLLNHGLCCGKVSTFFPYQNSKWSQSTGQSRGKTHKNQLWIPALKRFSGVPYSVKYRNAPSSYSQVRLKSFNMHLLHQQNSMQFLQRVWKAKVWEIFLPMEGLEELQKNDQSESIQEKTPGSQVCNCINNW